MNSTLVSALSHGLPSHEACSLAPGPLGARAPSAERLISTSTATWAPLALRKSSTGKHECNLSATIAASELVLPNCSVEEISKKKGVSMAQIACAWSMAKEGVTAPIVGTTSLKNLEDLLASVHIELTEEEIKYLEEPYKPTEVFGHW